MSSILPCILLIIGSSLGLQPARSVGSFLPCIECRPVRGSTPVETGTPRFLPVANILWLLGMKFVPPCCGGLPSLSINIQFILDFFRPPTKPEDATSTAEPQDPTKLYNTTDCGQKNSRIINGQPTGENEIPWMCSILLADDRWYGCGATLLSCDPVIIISAAHCFEGLGDFSISTLQVSCGDYDISAVDPQEVRADISEVILHPDFNSDTFDNDVAVIKLDDPAAFTCSQGAVWPACLPVQGSSYSGYSDTLATGWGNTQSFTIPGIGGISFDPSDTLLQASLLPVSNDVCNTVMKSRKWRRGKNGRRKGRQGRKGGQKRKGDQGRQGRPPRQGSITEGMLCASDTDGQGQDTCQGDSGGPLVSRGGSGGYSLVGITSWGIGCAELGSYGVYSRVSKYIDWVAQQYGLTGVASSRL